MLRIKQRNKDDVWQGKYKYFSADEMRCSCGECSGLPKHSHMVKLDRLRWLLRAKLPVSSGFRCVPHNTRIGGGPTHPAGVASDHPVYGWKALKVVVLGYLVGFRGIGVDQKGPVNERFIHLDTAKGTSTLPRPWLWSY